MTLRVLFENVLAELDGYYPSREAKSLVYTVIEHILGYNKFYTHKKFSLEINTDTCNKINNIVDRLKHYKPVQYILENCLFYDCNLKVTPGVLIPRPETEELVDLILKVNHSLKPSVLDIGTGSGCIAIALAKHLPKALVYATDISETALNIASGNAEKNGVNIQFFKKDILNPEPFLKQGSFDIVVSNPPYVRNSEKKDMHSNVLNWEPPEALFVPDKKPLLFYRSIARHARFLLKPGGNLFFEINENLANETKNLMISEKFNHIKIYKDIRGKDRMVWGRKQSEP